MPLKLQIKCENRINRRVKTWPLSCKLSTNLAELFLAVSYIRTEQANNTAFFCRHHNPKVLLNSKTTTIRPKWQVWVLQVANNNKTTYLPRFCNIRPHNRPKMSILTDYWRKDTNRQGYIWDRPSEPSLQSNSTKFPQIRKRISEIRYAVA